MSELAEQALWRISAFENLRQSATAASRSESQRQTILATTLQAELRLLGRRRDSADALEVVAACVRLREPALIYLQCEESVWPVTLFPAQMLYHSPRSLLLGAPRALGTLKTLEVEPPGVRPPGHWMYERVAQADTYHPLMPALWKLALQGPRKGLLHEVAGPAAYRALRNPATPELPTPGALGPAVERLRKESVSLRKITSWPGMSEERACRLINALYLTSNLIVSRAHHSARPGMWQWLLGQRGG